CCRGVRAGLTKLSALRASNPCTNVGWCGSPLGQGITLGAAAQFVESDKPAALGGDEDTASLMIESSIRF
ncbi:MAG: hypothetical protein AAF225_07225, partial [Pseudomonadota bacterium]